MGYVADLHIHSRFARACSTNLNIPNLAKWAKYKGIDLLGTGDCLHPLWFTEIKKDLKENGDGSYQFEDTKFILTSEVSCIYSEGGKVRRIHTLIFLPSIDATAKLAESLTKKGAKLMSDGRPILGMSSKQLCDTVFKAEPNALVIPAHCVLPSTLIHTSEGMRQIKDIKEGDLVYTHNNRKRSVKEVIKHQHKGKLYKILPWYFSLGLESTSEHPFYGFKTKYCSSTGDTCLPSLAHKKRCKPKHFEKYKPEWINAEDLRKGDILIFPRFTNTTPMPILSLPEIFPSKYESGIMKTRTKREYAFEENLDLNEDFCRLMGYYLAEGWVTSKGEIGFCFNSKEVSYIEDVKKLMQKVFKIDHSRTYIRKSSKGIELLFASRFLAQLFPKLFYKDMPFRAKNKLIPDWMLHLPINLQAQVFLGWYRGDAGYTVSRNLMNQMKIICLRLGIVPSINVVTAENFNKTKHLYKNRTIKASSDSYHFSGLTFFDDPYNLQNDPVFFKSKRILQRKHGWMDKNYIYMPIRKISTKDYEGEVFNLEVEEDNSYITEFATVHNCWTPWFSLYGSNSGYDSLFDCFGEFSDNIFAIETGLSSEPAMNWRIKELDNKSIVSFSDLHSLPRMGRECTIFKGEMTFESLRDSLINQKIIGTIEFFPEEGKYHYSGHRNCNIVYNPEQINKKGKICPVCNRPLTIGVMQRVEDLATRTQKEIKTKKEDGIIKSESFPKRAGFKMLVQLEEIIAESLGMDVKAQKVQNEYLRLVSSIDSELKILSKTPIDLIAMTAGDKIAQGIKKVREGDIHIEPGFDNTYGIVKIWDEEDKTKEDSNKEKQIGLF